MLPSMVVTDQDKLMEIYRCPTEGTAFKCLTLREINSYDLRMNQTSKY